MVFDIERLRSSGQSLGRGDAHHQEESESPFHVSRPIRNKPGEGCRDCRGCREYLNSVIGHEMDGGVQPEGGHTDESVVVHFMDECAPLSRRLRPEKDYGSGSTGTMGLQQVGWDTERGWFDCDGRRRVAMARWCRAAGVQA